VQGHVEVRLAGRDPELVYVDDPEAPEEPPAPGDDLSARITLRLPETLKGSLETAAAREGVSANAWIVRALARALEPRGARRSSNRLQGFARS
jgi:predicted HicB family RNase H-like nuclease